MNEIEQLTSRLRDPVAFAEEYCDWYSDDYCLYPDGSIYDAAIEAIEEWARLGSNLEVLKDVAG